MLCCGYATVAAMFLLNLNTTTALQRRLLSCTLGSSRRAPWTYCQNSNLEKVRNSAYSRPVSSGPPVIKPTTWVDKLPARARPYLYLTRIDKPIGTLLLFYPCGQLPALLCTSVCTNLRVLSIRYNMVCVDFAAWSITMASYALEAPFTTPLGYLSLFGLGALVMRGAGCTINDLWDRKLDRAVGMSLIHPPWLTRSYQWSERTRERPLANGDITPARAVAFLGVQLTAGLGVLTQLNWYRYVTTAFTCPLSGSYMKQHLARRLLSLCSDYIPLYEARHTLAASRPRCASS